MARAAGSLPILGKVHALNPSCVRTDVFDSLALKPHSTFAKSQLQHSYVPGTML